ncbi:hypothetical protein DERF_011554 [Dermatophagoides farinae]|uniref:Uncharacterized protein n=1 Tax=Dermatophagoides farinae TaxID=6954 RepID=A0A922L1R5_DERFA|nr:hypothetical protein DERF_011554 [Dermatophagoides farinae]
MKKNPLNQHLKNYEEKKTNPIPVIRQSHNHDHQHQCEIICTTISAILCHRLIDVRQMFKNEIY